MDACSDAARRADLVGPAAARCRLVVRAINDLAHHVGMEVMAEGVETEEQEQILLGEGVMPGQGFLYGRPAPLPAAA